MKKVISAIIVVFFSILQLFLPTTDPNMAWWGKFVIIVAFTTVWIVFTAYADEISEYICRNVFGRDLIKTNRITTVETFRSLVIPKAIEIEQFLDADISSKGTLFEDMLYDNWGFIINYIMTYCITNSNEINYKVVCKISDTNISNNRFTKIHIIYISNVIKTLLRFREKESFRISKYADFSDFDEMLNDIQKAFSKQIML